MSRKAIQWLIFTIISTLLGGVLAALLVWILRRRQRILGRVSEEEEIPLLPIEPPPSPSIEKGDDFTRLHGIGSRLAGVLNNAGIHTYQQLANTPIAHLDKVLRAAGVRLSNLETWPEQARLAFAGDWEGLEAWRQRLKRPD